MSKIRINDLARELEVKSKAILDSLSVVGITEKKTHSSSLEGPLRCPDSIGFQSLASMV